MWTTVPLRIALGVIFIAHGSQKLFGMWGGRGFSAFIGGEAPFSFMRPAWFWLGAAVFSEFLGGIFVLTGFLTRLGALIIAFVMLTAMLGVHWKNGFFLPIGMEYTLALLGIAIALLIAGGGRASVDEALLLRRTRSSSGGRRR
jgi:putative oxidoreductase